MAKRTKSRVVKRASFRMKSGETLGIFYNLLGGGGLHRVLITCDRDGGASVHAGDSPDGAKFSFTRFGSWHRTHYPHGLAFELRNPRTKVMIADYLRSRFWEQFGFGVFSDWASDKELNARIDAEIAKLVSEFESHSAGTLNKLLRQLKRERKRSR